MSKPSTLAMRAAERHSTRNASHRLIHYCAGICEKVAAAAESAGVPMIDAPVSGGVGGAIAGTLTFIVGGEEAH